MKLIFNRFKNKKSAYLDFAATTPVDSRVLDAMKPYWSDMFFNPSSSYARAQHVKKMIKENRRQIAQYCGVRENEIIFTQGGTESINLGIIGLIKKAISSGISNPHVLISAIEHPAVKECVEYVKTLGAIVEIVPVNQNGIIELETFQKQLREDTVLVSIIGASNETGAIQPLHKISSSIKKFKNNLGRTFGQYPFFHTDASQLTLVQDVSVSKTGADMITIDGSKIYAPKMTGLLVKKQYVELEPIIYGGGQEYGLRSGTESVASIVGLATAFGIAYSTRESFNTHCESFKKYFISLLEKTNINFEINSEKNSTSHILNICIKGLQSDYAVIQLDEYGVECASMTSCAGSKGALRSEILQAMGKDDCAGSSLRFSFGRTTSKSDIKKAVRVLQKVCELQKVI